MVFASLHPARNTYQLGLRFRMPTASGSKDAVAVPQKEGDQLLSGYTFLLGHIVLLIWWIAIIIALYISAKRHKNHPNAKLHTKIWQKRSSPSRIVKFAFQHFLLPRNDSQSESDPELQSNINPRTESRPSYWFILWWLWIGISFLVVKYAVPIYFARYIKLGNAAPVSPDAIYFPSPPNYNKLPLPQVEKNLKLLQFYQLFVPSTLRAVGSIDAVNSALQTELPLKIDGPEILGINNDGETRMRMGYRYSINGTDLGLQNYPDLVLNVEGSCMTEYGWWVNSTLQSGALQGVYTDIYRIFGSQVTASKYDSSPPTAKFFAASSLVDGDATTGTNRTWAALISSVNRGSFTNGTDPFYRTGPNPLFTPGSNTTNIAPYVVLPKRPVLSCWEKNLWSYQGSYAAVANLSIVDGIKLPRGIVNILSGFLSLPKVYSLGGYLGQSALTSSFTSTGYVFDANISSIEADLRRLVFASYIASVNTLTESTLFSLDTFSNALKINGTFAPGTSDFVIFSNDVEALSIQALIVIPAIAVGLWIILIIIVYLPRMKSMIASFKDGLSPLQMAKQNFQDGTKEQTDALKDEGKDQAKTAAEEKAEEVAPGFFSEGW